MASDSEFPKFTKDELLTLCRRNLIKNSKSRNFSILKHKFIKFDKSPLGFLGRHLYLEVDIELEVEKHHFIKDKLTFFVKTVPKGIAAQAKYVENFEVFKKETAIYKHLLPRLQDINIGCGNFAPYCYLVKSDVLVMENLAVEGFRMATNFDGTLDYDHLLCAMATIAKLHSATLILETKQQKKIPEMFGEWLEENAYPEDELHIRSVVFNVATNALSELIKLIPAYENAPNLSYILEEFPKKMRQIFDFCKPSHKFRNVFCHGDLWANNVMFRYDHSSEDKGKMPTECRLVDYQLGRYAPGILDVITILTIPTSSKFREQHLKNLLQNYYHFLEQQLVRYEINVEDVLPEREFWESVEHFKLAGLIESCLFSHLTLLPSNISTNMVTNSERFDQFLLQNREHVCREAFENDLVYRERLTDMISQIIDTYVLEMEDTRL